MSHVSGLSQHLPYMRRFARALTGSQKFGDALAVASIHTMAGAGVGLGETVSLRVRLYRAMIVTFLGPVGTHLATLHDAEDIAPAEDLRGLDKLGLELRLAFLLSALEGFSREEIALTLQMPVSEVAALLADAQSDISKQTKTDVLIIEDEVFISRDLARIVSGLGHEITGRVRTHKAAIESIQKKRPGLILADVQLADGSNGIDAVHQILASGELPVIFITAFPDRLLSGMRPEPTYLIAKPFSVDEIRAAISQVLFFRNKARRVARGTAMYSAPIIPMNARPQLSQTANALPC